MSDDNDTSALDSTAAIILLLPLVLLEGKIGSDMWAWFLTGITGISISSLQMAGIVLFYAFWKINWHTPVKRNTTMTMRVLNEALACVILWGFAAIVYAMGA